MMNFNDAEPQNSFDLIPANTIAKARLVIKPGNDQTDPFITLQQERHEKACLEKQIGKDKPKVIFADAVATSESDVLIGELAKILKGNGIEIGQNRLFEFLRQKGFLIKRDSFDYNLPSQRSMELGLFKVKETAITHSDGYVTVNKTVKVTGKGQQYFVNMFLAKHEQRKGDCRPVLNMTRNKGGKDE